MRPILIADQPDISYAGLIYIIRQKNPTAEIHRTCGRKDLLEKLRELPRSVVILDYTHSDFGGAEELIVMRESFPDSSWLLFSEELNVSFIRRMLFPSEFSGLNIVMKSAALEEIETAIRFTETGETVVNPYLSDMVQTNEKEAEAPIALTASERSIPREIAYGKTTKEIAYERHLSFHTVNTHRKNIFRKLGVNNVHEAIKYAVRAGIADLSDYFI